MEVKIDHFIGKIFTNIINENDEKLIFTTDKGDTYFMCHQQQCCECVDLNDVCGDLNDLLNSPILIASEKTDSGWNESDVDESYTWTFYELATIKGSVTLRWYGSSNGYYGEEVDIIYKEGDKND